MRVLSSRSIQRVGFVNAQGGALLFTLKRLLSTKLNNHPRPSAATDPYPNLAGTRNPLKTPVYHDAQYASSKHIMSHAPLERPNEPIESMRARLLYQSRKRGILETDLLFSTFAKKYLSTMTESELREYDRLLHLPDWDAFYWVIGKHDPHPDWKDSKVLLNLINHAKNEAKVILRMPDLDQR